MTIIRTALPKRQITISLDTLTDKYLTKIAKDKGKAKSRLVRNVVEEYTHYINQKKGV
jgi:hypothetical protein